MEVKDKEGERSSAKDTAPDTPTRGVSGAVSYWMDTPSGASHGEGAPRGGWGLAEHLSVVSVDLLTSLLGGLEGRARHLAEDASVCLLIQLGDEDIDVDQQVSSAVAIDGGESLAP